MARELNLSSIILIQRNPGRGQAFKCVYQGSNQIWLISSKVL